MALTAKFQADFSSFYKAVSDATAKLQGFQSEADDVSKSLDKMVNNLSGKNLISNATLMVKAVQEIGGAANLTDAELKRVSATVGEATAKMQRMGIKDIPAEFKQWAQAAGEVNKPVESIGESMGALAGIAKGIMGLQIVGWFKDAAAAGFQWASSLTKMQAQTELSFRDLQILEDVALSSGTSLETLTKSIQIMQQKIGDRTARKAIQDLGLSFDALLRMSPADQFAAIATALAKIEDPTQRNTQAARVFGNTYREITPAIRADLQGIAKDTKLVGDATIKAAEQAANEWDKAWNDIKKGSVAYLGMLSAMDRARRESVEKDSEAIAKMIAARGGQLPAVGAPGLTLPAGAGATTRDFDPEMISNIQILGETLNQQSESVRRNTEEFKKAADAQEKFNTAVSNSLEHVRLTQFRTGEAAVAASQNVAGFSIRMSEAVTINRNFSDTLTASTIKADSFGHVLTSNVLPSLQGIGGATHQAGLNAQTATSGMDKLNTTLGGMERILSGIQEQWAQAAVVGVRATKEISDALKKGDWVGAIVAATAALVPFIAKLFGASEESKKVSPMRDEFFKLQGGLETLNPKVAALEGNLSAVQAVFDAKTVQQYDAAIASLNKILERDTAAFDKATDAAEDYAHAIKNIPNSVPREGGGTVPGFATGTNGFVDFGAGTLAMLHGREAIIPESAVRQGGGGGVGGGVAVTINAQGAFFDTPGDLQRLADKVNDALTAKYGLTNRNRAA